MGVMLGKNPKKWIFYTITEIIHKEMEIL